MTPSGMMMAVRITAGERMDVGSPQPLFQTPLVDVQLGIDQYDVTPDGQRFLVLAPTGDTRQPPITVVVNWLAGLERP